MTSDTGYAFAALAPTSVALVAPLDIPKPTALISNEFLIEIPALASQTFAVAAPTAIAAHAAIATPDVMAASSAIPTTTSFLGAISITKSEYVSQVNHVPAPIVRGLAQPYAVPIAHVCHANVPRPVAVEVPRAVPVEVPRAVPIPIVAKAPTLFTSSMVDTGTKFLEANPAATWGNYCSDLAFAGKLCIAGKFC